MIHQKFVKEILNINGVKVQLVLKVQLRKDKPDGKAGYTNHLRRHKQELALQAHEIDVALNKIQETLKGGHKGSLDGWLIK